MLQSRQHNTRSWFLAFGVSVLSVAGCGGGGGGGDDTPAPPSKAQTPPPEQTPLEKTPLAFAIETAEDAAKKSIREVELALIYTRFAIQILNRPGIPVGTSTRNCALSGTESIDFADVDNSGTPTNKDTVTVRYEDCRDDASLLLKGQYILSLNSPPPGAEAVGSSGGVVQFAQFNAVVTDKSTGGTQINGIPTSAAPASLELNGNVAFSSTASDTMEELRAWTDDKGLQMQILDPTNPHTETLILTTAIKTLDYARATYSINLDSKLQSQLLSGEIAVSTPTSVTGSLNAFPTGGFFQVKGAVAIADVHGNAISPSKVDLRYSDSNHKDTSLSSPDWKDFCSLFYFWDPAYGTPEKDVVPTPPDMLYNSIPTGGVLSTKPTIIIQLARPLAGTAAPKFVFQPPQSSSAPSVNAAVAINGARLTLTPPQGTSLQPMTIYNIVPDQASYPAANGPALIIPTFAFSTE